MTSGRFVPLLSAIRLPRFPAASAAGSAIRDAAKLSTATAVAQMLNVAAAPLLTRLYGPEEMAAWGLLVAFLGMASSVSTLRYDMAVMAARTEDEARSIVVMSIWLTAGTTVVLLILFETLRRQAWLGFEILPAESLPFVGIGLLAMGLFAPLRYFALRQCAYGTVARITVLQQTLRVVLQLALAFVPPLRAVGLWVGEIAGRGGGTLGLFRAFHASGGGRSNWGLLRTYRRFPLVLLPSTFLDSLALALPVPVLAATYGPTVAAGFFLVQRVWALPASVIGAAVADVFFQRAAVPVHMGGKSLVRLVLRTSGALAAIALPAALALWLRGDSLFALVFGEEWRYAGNYATAMAPWLFASFAVSPVSRVFALSERPWAKFLYDLPSLLGLVCVPLVFSRADYDAFVTVAALSAYNCFMYMIYFALILRVSTTTKPNSDVPCAAS